ncbi:MAG: PEP-CTERM sorting domain-containing protein [Gemmatimonadaceae bacterium]
MKRFTQIAILLTVTAAPAFAAGPTVVPEPSTIALSAAGLLALGATAMWRSRRNKK